MKSKLSCRAMCMFPLMAFSCTSIAAVPDAAPIQWLIEDGGNGHWYQQWCVSSDCQETTTFEAVRIIAESQGGHLATITSLQERLFIVSQDLRGMLGGFQNFSSPDYQEPNGGWEWVTGEDWVYTDWLPSEPSNANGSEHYLFTCCAGEYNGWNDGDVARSFVIEWSADCNNDGVIDKGQILDGTVVDADENGVPDECDICLADLTGDGELNFFDVSVFLTYFQLENPLADFNGDGEFNFFDVSAFLSLFASGCS